MTTATSEPIGVYERTIRANLERIWENVRDWEHLPWLHAGAFESIELVDEGDHGWQADVGFAGGGVSRIRVALEVSARRYTTSTLSGPGEGTDIVTVLSPSGPDATDIEVSFHVPGIAPDDREAVFSVYRDLYRQLWDEDEEMMRERQAFLDGAAARANGTPGPVDLGDAQALRNSLPKLVDFGGRSYRLVEVDGTILAHSIFCPHLGGPFGESECEEGVITCPWHGYRFDVRTRECLRGGDYRLPAAPVVEVDASTGRATLRPQA